MGWARIYGVGGGFELNLVVSFRGVHQFADVTGTSVSKAASTSCDPFLVESLNRKVDYVPAGNKIESIATEVNRAIEMPT
jgi:hypothetical protein